MSCQARGSGKLLLGLDLGNTNLGCAVFEGTRIIERQSIAVAELDASPQMWNGRFARGVLDRVSVSVLSSVNPRRASQVCASLDARLGAAPLMIGSDVPVPVRACVDRPEEVGSDRLLNVLAAFRRKQTACLIVDLGTALTIDVCSKDGAYQGGVIAPGLEMSASALHNHTALLPRVQIGRPENVTGRNTDECIRSGLFWGTVSKVEGLVERLRAEHPETGYVFATGGGSAALAEACSVIDEVVGDLHLEGLMLAVESAGLIP